MITERQPTSPIFIIEGDDVMVYAGVGDACMDLEPIDAATGIFQGYDAAGRLLHVGVIDDQVVVDLVEGAPAPTKLEEVLRRYLSATGTRLPSDCGLPCLIEIAANYAHRVKVRSSIGQALRNVFRKPR